VNIIKTLIILKYLQFKPKLIHAYYSKFKTTDNLYNFILNSSKTHLIEFINYYYKHNEYTNNIINNLSNNKIISISNKIYKQNNKIINKI
jgi:hypothetical protein